MSFSFSYTSTYDTLGCVSCCEGMRRTLKVKPSDYIRGDVSLDASTVTPRQFLAADSR